MAQTKTNVSGGVGAALLVLVVIGAFVGLPIIVWPFLVAAIVGWVIATNEAQKEKARKRQVFEDRPWQKR